MALHKSPELEGKRLAHQFRADHKLGNQPIYDLIGLIERATGYDVAVIPAGADSHGLTMWDPERERGFIAVTQGLAYVRQRSSLAHELCHVLCKDNSDDLVERDDREIRADAFARHLLVPVDGVKELLGSGDHATPSSLSTVVQHFQASPALSAIVMHQAGFISRAQVDYWKDELRITTGQLATQFGWCEVFQALQTNSNQYRPPQQLVSRAIKAYQMGLVSAQVIATLRGLPVGQVLEELSSAGVFPAEVNAREYELIDLPEVHIDLSALDENGD